MAEAVIGSIAAKIVDVLGSQAIETVGKLWCIKHELEVLQGTVSMLQPVLDHAEEQYHKIPRIRVWVEKLKDAFYDVQDLLEELNIEAMRRELRGHNEKMKEVRTFFSSSNQLAFNLKMSDKVRSMRKRIQAIKDEKNFHSNECRVDLEAEREQRKREETHSFIPKGDVIGRDDDKETVMKFLQDSDVKENVSILPIVGIGGLGKTTLAKYVYEDSKFDLKMWVCVSTDFDVQKIVKKMLACATKEEPTEVTMELLQSKLRAVIDKKKYLLVLDDVWDINPETWGSLKSLLVGGARGSKILITTRLTAVAMITGTAPPHRLGGLSDSVSLDLLMQMAYPKEEIQDPEMVAIAKEIVRKCFGVPLVVRTVGSLLFFKKTKLEWLHFKDNVLPEVSQKEDRIGSVLRLSYDYLPSHLKQCFAFCSLFPKDYEIKKQTLVNLWVAEGFIRPSNGSTHLEDIAHEYFMDLLWSNFFQDFKKDPYTNEETCKMHDLMHDLACLVAGNECGVALNDAKSINERARHLSTGDLPISHLKACPLRTYLSCMRRQISEEDLCQLIQSFERLRILDLHYTCVEKVPRSICKLKYLTYLDLSFNFTIKRLPDSITRLQSLQILNLCGCSALDELPRGIRKLVSLRNLYIDDCPKLGYLPCGLGQLSSLHRLTRFILPKKKAFAKNYCRLGELNGLNNIRGSLCIENFESVTDAETESKAANLIGKHSLESLALKWGHLNTDGVAIVDRDEALLGGLRPYSSLQKLTIDGYKGESFPKWMMDSLVSSLPNLVEVCIFSCGRCKSLPPLGQLPHLKTLKIRKLTELEGHSFTSTMPFPSLLKLNIQNCEKLKAVPLVPHLEDLRLTKANIPLVNYIFGLNKLKRLRIEGIGSLECVPEECWKSLASLESLSIVKCPGLTSLSKAPPTPPGTRHQSNLVDLHSSDSHGVLQNLRSVRLVVLPKLASLPQWLLQASNLEHLSIWECKELDLCKDESGNNNNNLILDFRGGFYQSLRSLCINGLPKLASLPRWLLQASNLEHLEIRNCRELDICKDESGNLILDSHGGFQNLRSVDLDGLPKLASLPQWLLRASNLEDLRIQNCSNLKALPEQIEALQSLQRLEIKQCPSLTSLPEGMGRLASLTHLTVNGCEELESFEDESGNNNILDSHGGLHSLRSVEIGRLPKIASLPQWLLQASNLEHLRIENCSNLKALLEQIEALQSLQRLHIDCCLSLTSLPEGMRRLASLTHLRISNCRELTRRCKRDKGEDWHKIAHIPHILIF